MYQSHPIQNARQAIDPGVAFILAQVMANDSNRAMIFGYNSPLHFRDRTVAAKTGTSDNFKDAVTVGFTPDLAAVIWIGDILDIHHYMVFGSDGVFVATPAWHSFMEAALARYPKDWYTPPADVVAGPDHNWFLSDATSIARLPGDNAPSPTPKPPAYVIPPDPGTGPVLASPIASTSPPPGG